MHRKEFLSRSGLLLSALPLGGSVFSIDEQNISMYTDHIRSFSDPTLPVDESYWQSVRSLYRFSKDFINLENGYFSPQPLNTLAAHQKHETYINERPSWFMRREQRDAVESTREKLAAFLGCSPEELAITRNTTESMNILISGYPWSKGDEVIISNQDYGSMEAAYHVQERRSGIIVKKAVLPLHPKNDEEVIQAFMSLVTSKTKLIHVTHLIHLTGQVLPVKKIIEAAHAKNIEVMVDAAHSVAHIDFRPGELGADYLGASLHKWLSCPLGAGIFIIKKKHIPKIWPLMADDEYPEDNIRKFQHQGTRPVQTIMAIQQAIEFHNTIGSTRKANRLKFLKNYWVEKVRDLPNSILNTPVDDPERSGAIANFSLKNYKPSALSDKLLKDHKIFTVAIEHPAVNGVRITPHIYTSTEELDKLVSALRSL